MPPRNHWQLPSSGALAIAALVVSTAICAGDMAPSVEVTCVVLRDAIYAGAIVGHPLSGKYECTAATNSSILALRYKGPEVADSASNLVGYDKVSLSNGAVHAWDIGVMQLGKLVFSPRGKASAPK